MRTRFNLSFVKKIIWTGLAATLLGSPAGAQFVSTPLSDGLNEPSSITVDNNGVAYIADSGNNRIARFDPVTGGLSTLAGSTTPGTNNGQGGAEFFNPTGIAFARGGLVVVDQGNQLLRFVTRNGVVSNLAGVYSTEGGFVDGPALSAQFRFPTTVVADTNGNLYIADSGNNAIRLLDTNNIVRTIQVTNYQFYYPEGLALDGMGNLFVADTLNNVICVISNIAVISNQTVTVIAGSPGANGTNDAPLAVNARFNLPSGLFWDNEIDGLLIADTGNDTIREVFLTNGTGPTTWAVTTIAGRPLVAGSVDGSPLGALFNQPSAIATDPLDAGLYVVDSASSSIRVFLPTPPQPPVNPPVFGFVTFPLVGVPPEPFSTFNAASNAVFNNFNPPLLALQEESGTETYITYGPTPTDPFHNTIPLPGPNNGQSPEGYRGDGMTPPESAPSILQPMPDVTIYAVSQAPGRRPSPVVSAHFQFVCANPVINGVNAAAIQLVDTTVNATLFYTLDGSIPTDNGSNVNSFGPVDSGQILALNLQSNSTLSVRAFRPGFTPSDVAFEALSVSNFVANELTFGFPTGEEASSEFVAAAGQKFVAPVTLSLLPGARMYSLQFNATVTNLGSAPPLAPTYDFISLLVKPDPNNPGIYITIPPLMFAGDGGFTNGIFADTAINLLGVGWLERYSKTNLYNTLTQDLITYSLAKDDLFLSSGGKVIVGGYSFLVPTNAQNGQQYRIQLGRPSASADGIGVTPALVGAPTNGSLTAGTMNSIKNVVVGSAQYLVGDVNRFRWFNAGDFGDGNLDNSDVEEVFQSAIYFLNEPPTNSDMWDAMDSSDASVSSYPTLFTDSGAAANGLINSMTMGDGSLDISDVYVTFRRSLDPTLNWYVRFWSNGVLNVEATSNAPQRTVARSAPVKTGVSSPHTLTVAADQVIASGGTAVVPLRVVAPDASGLPIRTLMFDIQVQPLDGSPALTSAVTFMPAPGLGAPFTTTSRGLSDVGAAWLDTTVAGISGADVIGNVVFSVPPGTGANSAYRIVVSSFSASPNGLGVFKTTALNGLVTLSDRTGSTWGDGIPDVWRLLYFGTISDPASAAAADPDGDGEPNWQEYIAGTDPLNARSVFKLLPGQSQRNSAFTLQWATVAGKHYSLQSASSPSAAHWTTVLTNAPGTGNLMNWSDTNGAGAKFFRALAQ